MKKQISSTKDEKLIDTKLYLDSTWSNVKKHIMKMESLNRLKFKILMKKQRKIVFQDVEG